MTLVRKENHAIPNMLDQLFRNEWPSLQGVSDGALSVPAVNIKQDDKSFVLEMALPGVNKQDVKIDLDHKMLKISSEKTEENNEERKEDNFSRREFNYERFSRSFTLPDTVDYQAIDAKYEDGILRISIPKKAEVTNAKRSIEIK